VATAFTHVLVGGLLGGAAPEALPRARLAVAGALLAAAPDLDVVAFQLGIPYEHPLGHRGFTHSLLFAALVGPLTAGVLLRGRLRSREGWIAAALLTAAMASHGLLDAFTDAGRGVGFWIPLSDARFFFPWQPLATSPIGVEAFFRFGGLAILWNEIRWVWLPVLSAAALFSLLRRREARRA
jgi:inner membrane protein